MKDCEQMRSSGTTEFKRGDETGRIECEREREIERGWINSSLLL